MARFSGKVAVVTGSSNGIGRATAILLASEGAKVTITGRDSERLEETRQAVLKAGVQEANVNSVVADITTSKGQDLIISSTLKKFGQINILINNAGANLPDASGNTRSNCTIENLQKMLQLNLQSVVEMTQKTRPHLGKTRGEIVNISSIGAGPSAQPQSVYYSTAKAALDQYSRCTAIDLISEGIRINVVQPGLVSTGFSTAARGLSADDSLKFYNSMGELPHCIPAGYCGQPEHLASVIAFLADRKASEYIVGQTIIADGGTSLVLGMHSVFGGKK
ncbi:hypothetical protein B9Z55_013761 [Caenorhabditis nigoni]|uniref:Uncharacterized protein n=1 Tax=Caenorhabditis nigoni TaxID=1611254 RepID=A0A2G5U348_9PELO|nr:hypothetical protein B9Z55_013761 [Caenorhabditis nigoni]